MRAFDDRISKILPAGDGFVAFGGYGHERLGVSAYGPDGRLRFRLLAGEDVWNVQAAGPYA